MRTRSIYVVCSLLMVLLVLAACGPSEAERNAERNAQATVVAAAIFATQTAEVPTSTPTATATPTKTPTPTAIPTKTPPPTPTATPAPGAIIVGGTMNVRAGPGTQYAQQGTLNQNTELDVIGQFEDCAWLKVSGRSQAMTGWISGDRSYVDLRSTCGSLPPGTFRPLTGVIKPNQRGGGDGEFTVDNGTSKDGVVILMFNEEAVAAVYIRAGDSSTIRGIRDGTYYLYFSTGDEWNGEKFTVTPSYQRFEDSFEFTTGATTYTTWSVTLHGVIGGTASAEQVDETEFPDLDQ